MAHRTAKRVGRITLTNGHITNNVGHMLRFAATFAANMLVLLAALYGAPAAALTWLHPLIPAVPRQVLGFTAIAAVLSAACLIELALARRSHA